MMKRQGWILAGWMVAGVVSAALAEEAPSSPGASASAKATADQTAREAWWKPHSPPCVERENVFEFSEKPKVKNLGNDKYEITFAVKGNCDVTAGIVDDKGTVVRHLGSGVLGSNAPRPFQKNSLKQTIYWNGKDDLDEYHKTPEKLKVRVMLGLKPTFERLLDEGGPKDLPGRVWAIAIDKDAAYVFCFNQVITVRKFDREGNYVESLVPPPANVPEAKLGGLTRLEYEPGKWALHSVVMNETVSGGGEVLCNLSPAGFHRLDNWNNKPVVVDRRLVCSGSCPVPGKEKTSRLHWLNTDGSTDVAGMNGIPFLREIYHFAARLAASPDGKRIYATFVGTGSGYDKILPAVTVTDMDSESPGKVFVGDLKKPGSDNTLLNEPTDVDCDAGGNVYVGDHYNNRVQVFSPEGKHLQTIEVSRPAYLCVHRKTGAIYVLHVGETKGRSVPRLTKFASKDSPSEEFHQDWLPFGVMALDQWSAKPRLWVAGGGGPGGRYWQVNREARDPGVQIWEERDKQFVKIADFDEDAATVLGAPRTDRWKGGHARKPRVVCDATREVAYWGRVFFDLKTGKKAGQFATAARNFDDMAFDKRGYMHIHFNPGFYTEGVARLDPFQGKPSVYDKNTTFYPEIPYDYGLDKSDEGKPVWKGVLPVRDQPGAKFFQDGIGVNMRGDVAEVCNIWYVPKMEEEGGIAAFGEGGLTTCRYENGDITYAKMLQAIQDRIRKGEDVYSVRRQPGLPLAGGTIWVWDRNGELRTECAVAGARLVNGCLIDDDYSVYFTGTRPRMVARKAFLDGHGSVIGVPDDRRNSTPYTGTAIKTKPDARCRYLMNGAPIKMDMPPERPAEVSDMGGSERGQWGWVEGAEWLYAGSSPIVPCDPCSCPTQRAHLDWYKRSYVPEAYRHSIGILDTAGNLIMHLGRYGNYDSGFGDKSNLPIGGDNIAMFMARYISGTDNYLVFFDWAERLVQLKLDYHAEETVGIQ